MGNNCICFDKSKTPEIFTLSKTTADNMKFDRNKTSDIYGDYKESIDYEKFGKSKASNYEDTGPLNIDQDLKMKVKSSAQANENSDTNNAEETPILRENFMDFSMDLFDEINKYRKNPDMFFDLTKTHPCIIIFY